MPWKAQLFHLQVKDLITEKQEYNTPNITKPLFKWPFSETQVSHLRVPKGRYRCFSSCCRYQTHTDSALTDVSNESGLPQQLSVARDTSSSPWRYFYKHKNSKSSSMIFSVRHMVCYAPPLSSLIGQTILHHWLRSMTVTILKTTYSGIGWVDRQTDR